VAFSFHAGFVDCDRRCRRLTFADRNDETGQHYFVIDRAEENPEQAVPGMGNVYIERDDQQFGGFGGIKRVVLGRDNLTLHLGRRMSTQMGRHQTICVTFSLKATEFKKLRQVLSLIMCGYESQLELLP
jgi:hypothetical protein